MTHHSQGIAPAEPIVERGASPRSMAADALAAAVGAASADGTYPLTESDADDKAGPSKQVAPTEATGDPVWVAVAEILPERRLYSAVKRLSDAVVAGVGLLLVSPLLAVIAALIKLDSEGPVLYRQVRVGRRGELFPVLKFRSMVTDAERHGPRWARSFDTRVTRVGGFLRRTSLDELPQLWNIVLGDMSIVGPRPERPVFVARFRTQIEDYDLRHTIRPGLTGWAQVNGLRGNVSIETRTQYDLHYVRNASLWLDLMIFLRTFAAVIAGE